MALIRAFGGAEGNRTPDLLIANETRYQLRHSPLTGHTTAKIITIAAVIRSTGRRCHVRSGQAAYRRGELFELFL